MWESPVRAGAPRQVQERGPGPVSIGASASSVAEATVPGNPSGGGYAALLRRRTSRPRPARPNAKRARLVGSATECVPPSYEKGANTDFPWGFPKIELYRSMCSHDPAGKPVTLTCDLAIENPTH